MYMNGFECLACSARQAVDYAGYTCPRCNGNLEVTYDYPAIRAGLAGSARFAGARDDIFKYAPLLPIHDAFLAPPLRIGATPLYSAARLGAGIGLDRLFIKDDGLNPSASFKDRAGAVALVVAREQGARVIAGASTGNAGSSMACLAASVGMPCVIFVPEKAPPAKLTQLLVFGARLLAVRGTYDDAFDLCHQVCAANGWFNRNTGFNPFTREGKKTCSYEICEQLGWNPPDWVVVPVGDGNIISGIWKGLRDLHAVGLIPRLPRLVCAQAEASAAISQAVAKLPAGAAPDWSTVVVQPVQATTLADSISVDLPRDGLAAVRAVHESRGLAVTVPDAEILAAIPELARLSGVFAEPAAATGWAALKKLQRQQAIARQETVVLLVTGNGLKDIASARKAAGEPRVIDATLAAAQAALRA